MIVVDSKETQIQLDDPERFYSVAKYLLSERIARNSDTQLVFLFNSDAGLKVKGSGYKYYAGRRDYFLVFEYTIIGRSSQIQISQKYTAF